MFRHPGTVREAETRPPTRNSPRNTQSAPGLQRHRCRPGDPEILSASQIAHRQEKNEQQPRIVGDANESRQGGLCADTSARFLAKYIFAAGFARGLSHGDLRDSSPLLAAASAQSSPLGVPFPRAVPPLRPFLHRTVPVFRFTAPR